MSPFLKDLIERVVRTFLASVFSGLATVASTTPGTPGELRVAIFALLTSSLTAALGVATKFIGSGDTASVIQNNEDEYGVDDVE